jgi:hypothetical protein
VMKVNIPRNDVEVTVVRNSRATSP